MLDGVIFIYDTILSFISVLDGITFYLPIFSGHISFWDILMSFLVVGFMISIFWKGAKV